MTSISDKSTIEFSWLLVNGVSLKQYEFYFLKFEDKLVEK